MLLSLVSYHTYAGNSYKIYSRPEITAFALTQTPDEGLKVARETKDFKTKVNSKKARLEEVVEELDGMDAKKIALREEKKELEQWLVRNDLKFNIKFEKEEAIRQKEQLRLQKEAEKQAKEQQRLNKLAEKQSNEAMKLAKANKKLMDTAMNNNMSAMSNNMSAMYYSQPLLYQHHQQLQHHQQQYHDPRQENANKKRMLDSLY